MKNDIRRMNRCFQLLPLESKYLSKKVCSTGKKTASRSGDIAYFCRVSHLGFPMSGSYQRAMYLLLTKQNGRPIAVTNLRIELQEDAASKSGFFGSEYLMQIISSRPLKF